MDRKELLRAEIQAFILKHAQSDLAALMLQKDKYPNLPLREIIEQINARRKAEKKLPTWYQTSGILYPPAVSIEQSSSEITARYKAQLFSGSKALDLTGGFGVDSYYLANRFEKLIYIEKNKDLAAIVRYNFVQLQQKNIVPQACSAEDFLAGNKEHFDLIYIDPDRRPGEKRVTGFTDSKPNIPSLLADLQKTSANILIKASPMLDIITGLKQLDKVKMVIVLAIANEVKELLFWLDTQNLTDTTVRCVNLNQEGEQTVEYRLSEEKQEYCQYSEVLNYLYEPNAAIMKAGAYKLLCKRYKILKLHQHTHLYTASKFVREFPGRKFKIIALANYNKSRVLSLLNSPKANISTRNFVDPPDQVKKKLGLQDGGQQYLFAFRDVNEKPCIAICEKV
jgi:PG_1098 ferredoxin-like domain/THUMP domain-like